MRGFARRSKKTRNDIIRPQATKPRPGRATPHRNGETNMSIEVLAKAVPSTSAGMNWLYQFTNNLTNLTTQSGGALTQLGLTELSAIAFMKLVSMVVNWNTSAMTLRF